MHKFKFSIEYFIILSDSEPAETVSHTNEMAQTAFLYVNFFSNKNVMKQFNKVNYPETHSFNTLEKL